MSQILTNHATFKHTCKCIPMILYLPPSPLPPSSHRNTQLLTFIPCLKESISEPICDLRFRFYGGVFALPAKREIVNSQRQKDNDRCLFIPILTVSFSATILHHDHYHKTLKCDSFLALSPFHVVNSTPLQQILSSTPFLYIWKPIAKKCEASLFSPSFSNRQKLVFMYIYAYLHLRIHMYFIKHN